MSAGIEVRRLSTGSSARNSGLPGKLFVDELQRSADTRDLYYFLRKKLLIYRFSCFQHGMEMLCHYGLGLLVDPNFIQHECIIQSGFVESVVAPRCATMTSPHVNHKNQWILVGLQRA